MAEIPKQPPGMVLKPYKFIWKIYPTSTGDRRISEPSTVSSTFHDTWQTLPIDE